jgi:hypothetical protein
LHDDLFEHVTGTIKLMWAHDDHELAGKKIVKVSLKTGDETTARERWGQVHSQVECLIKRAVQKARGADPRQSDLQRVEGLSPAPIPSIPNPRIISSISPPARMSGRSACFC